MSVAKQHITQPQDTTLTLTNEESVSISVNQDIFTMEGNLKQQYEFTGDEAENSTVLVSFKWPLMSKVAIFTTHWIPTVKLVKSDRKVDFIRFLRSTAENIGLNKWEFAKLVMKQCLEQFGAYLLEVTLLGVRLGHLDVKSAMDVQKRKDDVTELLMHLLADTEYLFRDAVVEWTVTVATGSHTPVQESSSASRQESSHMSSLAVDGPRSLKLTSLPIGSAQAEGEFDWGPVGVKELLVQVLKRTSWMQTSYENLNQMVANSHRATNEQLKELNHKLDDNHRITNELLEMLDRKVDNNHRLMIGQLEHRGDADHGRQNQRAIDNRLEEEDSTASDAMLALPSQESGPSGDGGTFLDASRDSNQISGWVARREENVQGRSSVRAPPNNERQQENSSGRTAVQLVADDDNLNINRDDSRMKIKENPKKNRPPSEITKENVSGSPSTPRNNTAPSTPRQHPDPSPSSSGVRHQSPHTRQSLNRTPNRPQSPAANWKPAAPNGQQPKQQSPASTVEQTHTSRRQFPSSSASSSASSASNTADVPSGPRRGSSTSQQSSTRTQGTDSGASVGHPMSSSRPDSTKSVAAQDIMTIECDSEAEAKLVKESVNKAYLEDEVKPPKAKSFDTMLCLDISDSMKEGGAFEKMKETVMEFIDGVEDTVTMSGVEENMGLVTFGGRANVAQNLTNDFSRIRDKIDLMEPGGKSPFVEALLVAMAAFVKKGGIVSVSGEWEVKPRIIFISDGCPTESTESGDRDIPSNITNVRLSLSRMLISFRDSDNFNKVHPVIFVPVGQHADRKYMEAMSKICDGVYMEPENIKDLCHYFRVQETIGKVLVCLKREAETAKPEKIEATVTALTPYLSKKETNEVLEVVTRELANPDRVRTRRPRPTEFDYVFEDLAKVEEGERLALGTRVKRGPDWDWGDQDAGGPGTVINHHERHSIHWVQWDNADYNCYPYSSRRGYHIWKTDDDPRLRTDDEPLDIGMTVIKGPDWKSTKDQADQGIGKGVIIRRSREKGKVMVRWSNGVKQICQWSPSGVKEVEYCHPNKDVSNDRQTSTARTEHANQHASQNASGVQVASTFDGDGVWQWRDTDNIWRSYDKMINKEIEAACKKKTGLSCLIERDGKQRRVMFRKMVEKVIDEGTECEVRRTRAADA